MRKSKKIKGPEIKSNKNRIPEPSLNETTYNKFPNISFSHLCESKGQLQDLSKQDLKQLSNFLRRISSMTWAQIRSSDGVKMKKIPRHSLSYALPQTVSEDEDIFEMRVSQEHRIWGFPNNGTFYVVWFDPTHAVCPV
jgi:hypothetical protein